jgi:uracil-DNA glycosylase
MINTLDIPEGWREVLREELAQPYIETLSDFVANERATQTVYPPDGEEFTALRLTPYEAVRAVILGQDPYHGPGQAHGLAFSVRPGIAVPPSLMNIYKELRSDLGIAPVRHGYLVQWAQQGVLLLNTVLTVRAGEANSHKGRGWEKLTDAIIHAVSARATPAVFILWGAPAQKKATLVDETRHTILRAAHPSPLSARNGFFGSRPFSQTNRALALYGQPSIEWQLSAQPEEHSA